MTGRADSGRVVCMAVVSFLESFVVVTCDSAGTAAPPRGKGAYTTFRDAIDTEASCGAKWDDTLENHRSVSCYAPKSRICFDF